MIWNTHRIRPSRNQIVPSGRPVIMFGHPEVFGTHDLTHHVSAIDVEVCKMDCTFKREYPCDEDIFELCCIEMYENNWTEPIDPYEASDLYKELRTAIRNDL